MKPPQPSYPAASDVLIEIQPNLIPPAPPVVQFKPTVLAPHDEIDAAALVAVGAASEANSREIAVVSHRLPI